MVSSRRLLLAAGFFWLLCSAVRAAPLLTVLCLLPTAFFIQPAARCRLPAISSPENCQSQDSRSRNSRIRGLPREALKLPVRQKG